MHKKEGDSLISELKKVVIRKSDYLLSKKIILESEIYSLIKLFFKSYFEIDYELSFIDLVDYIYKINLKDEIKDKTVAFLNNLNKMVYSGVEFSREEFHSIISEFKDLVGDLIKEKEQVSLLKEGLQHALKTPFIKRLFIKKKNIKLEKDTSAKKTYSSVREKLIENINNSIGYSSVNQNKEEPLVKEKKPGDFPIVKEDKQDSSTDLFDRYGPNHSSIIIKKEIGDDDVSKQTLDEKHSFNSIKDTPITPYEVGNINWSADSDIESSSKPDKSENEGLNNSLVKEFIDTENTEDRFNKYLDRKQAVLFGKEDHHGEDLLLNAEKYMDNTSKKLNKIISNASNNPKSVSGANVISFHLKINKIIEKVHEDISKNNIKQLVIDYKNALGLYKLLTKKEKKLFYSDLMSAYDLINKHKK